MILQVMVAFDKKAQVYLTPFFVQKIDMAVRSLMTAVNAESAEPIAHYPEDFSLWHLGSYNDEAGHITMHSQPVHICEAISLSKRHNETIIRKDISRVQHKIA